MKKTLKQFITVTGIATMLLVGFSVASAEWNPPVRTTGTGVVVSPTADTAKPVDASINTGMFDQVKKGGVTISTLLKSLVSPLSFFKKTLLHGPDTSIYIGGASFADPSFASSFPGNRSVPMTIDLTGRSNQTGAIKFKTNALCPQSTKLINSGAQAFEFWNSKEDTNADLLAKAIRLDGGNPAPGKILVSVDNNGRAVWATPKLAANGRDITFERDNDSPVGICGTPYTPPSCPTGQSRDSDGYCKCDNTGLDPIAPPTYPTNRGIQTYNCTATGVCTAGMKFQSPPFLLKKLRNANGTPASMPNKCVIATKPVNLCPDGDNFGDEIYTDSAGNSYPIYSGTGSEAGKYEVVTGLGDSCTESTNATLNGIPYNNYQVSVFP